MRLVNSSTDLVNRWRNGNRLAKSKIVAAESLDYAELCIPDRTVAFLIRIASLSPNLVQIGRETKKRNRDLSLVLTTNSSIALLYMSV